MPRLAGSFRHAVTKIVRAAPAHEGARFQACFSLSGCFSLLAVLVHIGHRKCSALEVVPPASDRVSCPAYSGSRTASPGSSRAGSHPLQPAFHAVPLRPGFVTRARSLGAQASSRNTCEATAPALAPSQVWARALSLAATRAISVDFSSSGYLDVSVPPVVPAWDGLPRGSRP